MFTKIADTLTDKGFKVYSLGKHKGECTEPFILVRETIPGNTVIKSLSRQIIDIHPYYPLGKYTQVMGFIESVAEAMNSIPELESVHTPEVIIIDDEKAAYTTRLSYQRIKRR